MTEMQEALERWQQAMEDLQPVWIALWEAIRAYCIALSEQLRPTLLALAEWPEEARREELYRRLRCWRIPHGLARFLAGRWPVRWLPWPEV